MAGLNVGTWAWESGLYVCERSIRSGRRGGWSVYGWCRVVMYFSLFCGNGMVWGAVMVSGEKLGERGRKKERKERTGRGSLNDVSAKTKICMERKQDLR